LRALGIRRHEARLLQALQVDRVRPHLREVARAHFRRLDDGRREEAALRQAALQRHLAALEADLVEAPGTRLLTLVAAPGRLARARADAAADASAIAARARGGFDRVQFHLFSPRPSPGSSPG